MESDLSTTTKYFWCELCNMCIKRKVSYVTKLSTCQTCGGLITETSENIFRTPNNKQFERYNINKNRSAGLHSSSKNYIREKYDDKKNINNISNITNTKNGRFTNELLKERKDINKDNFNIYDNSPNNYINPNNTGFRFKKNKDYINDNFIIGINNYDRLYNNYNNYNDINNLLYSLNINQSSIQRDRSINTNRRNPSYNINDENQWDEFFDNIYNDLFRNNYTSNFSTNQGTYDLLNLINITKSKSHTDNNKYKKLLKKFKMTKKYCKKNDKGKLEYPSCCICITDIIMNQDTILINCGHMFHDKCVNQWFDTKKSCPSCRYDLNQESK